MKSMVFSKHFYPILSEKRPMHDMVLVREVGFATSDEADAGFAD
jgi:hypothetical protein